MVVSRVIYYMYGIVKRCFGKVIKLNQINERKTFNDLGDKKLTKTIFQGNLYKWMLLIPGFTMRCLPNGSINFVQVSRCVELLNG